MIFCFLAALRLAQPVIFAAPGDSGGYSLTGPATLWQIVDGVRLLGALLRSASDPLVSMGQFALGVRVGPNVKMPRCPKLYAKKRKWIIPEQREQQNVEEELAMSRVWNQNYQSVRHWTKRFMRCFCRRTDRPSLSPPPTSPSHFRKDQARCRVREILVPEDRWGVWRQVSLVQQHANTRLCKREVVARMFDYR